MITETNPWPQRVSEFIPDFMNRHEFLRHYIGRGSVVMHGSTMLGIDDAFSDIDLWLILPDDEHAELIRKTKTDFFAFHDFYGKEGHLNAEAQGAFHDRLHRSCHMDTIFQLRSACLILDHDGMARRLIDAALRPMRQEVRRAWFFYHYVEMRGEHRACDNPIERNDSVALLLALGKTVRHAMQAAMVLDTNPYPYDKWLYRAAQAGPVGSMICRHVKIISDLIGTKGLEQGGPESGNHISLELREIRRILIDTAIAEEMDEPWLNRWWEHMNAAKEAINGMPWV